jgi:hypothetical protein
LRIRHTFKSLATGAFLLALTCPAALPFGQDEPQTPAEAPYEFVSGTVVEFSGGKLVVNRTIPGKPAEDHTFTITADTKVEGNLKVQARVTVGYRSNPESGELIAVRIIVREAKR